MTVGGART